MAINLLLMVKLASHHNDHIATQLAHALHLDMDLLRACEVQLVEHCSAVPTTTMVNMNAPAYCIS